MKAKGLTADLLQLLLIVAGGNRFILGGHKPETWYPDHAVFAPLHILDFKIAYRKFWGMGKSSRLVVLTDYLPRWLGMLRAGKCQGMALRVVSGQVGIETRFAHHADFWVPVWEPLSDSWAVHYERRLQDGDKLPWADDLNEAQSTWMQAHQAVATRIEANESLGESLPPCDWLDPQAYNLLLAVHRQWAFDDPQVARLVAVGDPLWVAYRQAAYHVLCASVNSTLTKQALAA